MGLFRLLPKKNLFVKIAVLTPFPVAPGTNTASLPFILHRRPSTGPRAFEMNYLAQFPSLA